MPRSMRSAPRHLDTVFGSRAGNRGLLLNRLRVLAHEQEVLSRRAASKIKICY